MAELELRWRGLAELRTVLAAMPDKLRRRVLRNALAAGARIVRDAAKSGAPVLRRPTPYRKPGTVRDAIKVRTSKAATRRGDVGVFVNVQPLKGRQVAAFKGRTGLGGGKNPNDPFYWRWLEFGREGRAGQGAQASRRTGGRFVRARRAQRAVGPLQAYGFLQRGAQRLTDALRKIEQVLGPAVHRLNNKDAQP